MALTGEEKKIWQREYDKARRLAQKDAKQKAIVKAGNSTKSQVQNGQSKIQTLRKPSGGSSIIPFASSSFTTEFRDIEEQKYRNTYRCSYRYCYYLHRSGLDMTGIVNSTGARSGVIGTTVGTPAGHIIKITTHSTDAGIETSSNVSIYLTVASVL